MDEPIPHAPPPWTLKGDAYFLPFWVSRDIAASPPPFMYSPLEAASPFASPSLSKPIGGLSMIQIIRYHETPVGPYDEFILIPGSFEYAREDATGRRASHHHIKITRIYVSQRETCYNGRVNWNVPKHLARFTWTTDPATKALTVRVFPEDSPSPTPFFTATFKPTPLLPSFPFSADWMNWLGFSTRLVQPPLPRGPEPEVPATQGWKAVVPKQWSRRCSVGWFDMTQTREDADAGEEFFWPGFRRWRIGVVMKDAEIVFEQPEVWEGPASNE